MIDTQTLELIVRTPHNVVLQTNVHSIRVLTETGQVGLRPRMEAMVLAVESGIVNLELAEPGVSTPRFVGTAGGVLINDGLTVTLLTPIAVVGSNLIDITQKLESVSHQPNSEMQARTALNKLEGHILNELRELA